MNLTGKLLIAAASLAVFSSSAMAADLYVPPAAAAAVAPASTNWDGPYIGATLGYGWSNVSVTSGGSGSGTGQGFLLGGQIGYNFHVSDPLVLGIQGNLDWDNESGSGGVVTSATGAWDGALVARLGIDAGQFLPYVEAGVAFANANATFGGTTYNATHTGWTVGAGVEFMLTDQLSTNVEVRYDNYGSATYGPASASLTDTQFRVGLNYHF